MSDFSSSKFFVFYMVAAFSLCFACAPEAIAPDENGGGEGGGGPCTGAACYNKCPAGSSTTLTGRVLAPNGIDPVPGAAVYAPRSISEFPEKVDCEICAELNDNAIVATMTDVEGRFTLSPVPTSENQIAGTRVAIMAQKGRFRKHADIVIDNPCAVNTTEDSDLKLPSRTNGHNNVPKIAVATGDFDVMECVLLKLGLEQDAFDLYDGMDPFGSTGSAPRFDTLLNDLDKMKGYNIIFINCSSGAYEEKLREPQIRANIANYVKSGGRLYVTDWSYDYVEQVEDFAPIIDFAPGESGQTPEEMNAAAIGTSDITTEATVHDDVLREWLMAVERVSGQEVISDDGKVHIGHFAGGWVMQYQVPQRENTKVWLSGNVQGDGLNGVLPLTTTFDVNQCGRVLYSSYHTSGRDEFAIDPFATFPAYCAAGPLSPQERVLEYLIMHMADCITVD